MNYIKIEYDRLHIIDKKNIDYKLIIEELVKDELSVFYIVDKGHVVSAIDKYDVIYGREPSLKKEYIFNFSEYPSSKQIHDILKKYLFKKIVVFVDNKLICEYRNLEYGYFPRQIYRNYMALRCLWYFKQDFKRYLVDNGYREIIIISCWDIRLCFSTLFPDIKVSLMEDLKDIVYHDDTLILDFKYGEDYYRFLDGNHLDKLKNFFLIAETIVLKIFQKYCISNNVKYAFVQGPIKDKLTCLSEIEKKNFNDNRTLNDLLCDDTMIKVISSDSDDYEYLRRRLLGATYVLNNGFSLIESNFSSKYLNIKEGIRKTIPCVEEQENSIHIFGPCITNGYMVSDKNTIASYLQRIILDCKVYNHGTNNGQFLLCDVINALNTAVRAGDYFIFILESDPILEHVGIHVHNSTNMFNEKKNKNFFYDCPAHCNKYANQLLAEYIYNIINLKKYTYKTKKESFFDKFATNVYNFEHYDVTNPDLCSFYIRYSPLKEKLKKYKKIGGILAHAAPFTNGHKYLVETALKEMEAVVFFVMGDYLHSLSVMDRVEMAKINLMEYANVYVVPIESFAISATYFPAYASRNNELYSENNLLMYTGEMVDKYVFGYFGIKHRFLGEEEPGSFTDRYNSLVKKAAALQGIKVYVIPRSLDAKGKVISATSFRNVSEFDNYNDVKDILSYETFSYIKDNDIVFF